uniref:Putative secreted protein n=1 Tax=Ixodes ricinus TaxID=34613 RepID=A0A6B0TU13_IXORI
MRERAGLAALRPMSPCLLLLQGTPASALGRAQARVQGGATASATATRATPSGGTTTRQRRDDGLGRHHRDGLLRP